GREKTTLPVWTEGVDRIPSTSAIAYTLTNRIRARTAPQPDSEPVRWELMRLALGSIYDLKNEKQGNVFATVIVRPTPDRFRLRADLAHTTDGPGGEVLTTAA